MRAFTHTLTYPRTQPLTHSYTLALSATTADKTRKRGGDKGCPYYDYKKSKQFAGMVLVCAEGCERVVL